MRRSLFELSKVEFDLFEFDVSLVSSIFGCGEEYALKLIYYRRRRSSSRIDKRFAAGDRLGELEKLGLMSCRI